MKQMYMDMEEDVLYKEFPMGDDESFYTEVFIYTIEEEKRRASDIVSTRKENTSCKLTMYKNSALLEKTINLLMTNEFMTDFETGRVHCPWCHAWGDWDLEPPRHDEDCPYVSIMTKYVSVMTNHGTFDKS